MRQSDLFFAVALGFVVLLASGAAWFLLRARSASRNSWSAILDRLAPVDHEKVAEVALNLVDEAGTPRAEGWPELEPEQIWELLGGVEGLEVLAANCDVLVDLAAYVQRWHPEALLIAEKLRLNAREIKWHVERLQGAQQTGNLEATFATYAQKAAATYFLMTRNVLGLYEAANVPGLAELQAAL